MAGLNDVDAKQKATPTTQPSHFRIDLLTALTYEWSFQAFEARVRDKNLTKFTMKHSQHVSKTTDKQTNLYNMQIEFMREDSGGDVLGNYSKYLNKRENTQADKVAVCMKCRKITMFLGKHSE